MNKRFRWNQRLYLFIFVSVLCLVVSTHRPSSQTPPSTFTVGVCICGSSSVSLPLPPPPPTEVPPLTDLSFEEVSDTTISLTWTPFNTTAVTGYRITVVAAGESVPIFEDFVQPSTGHYKVYGLEPGIDYDISVITVTDSGESEPITITQQTCKNLDLRR